MEIYKLCKKTKIDNPKTIIELSQNPKCIIKIGDELEIKINKKFTDKQIKNIKEYFGLEVENIKGEQKW